MAKAPEIGTPEWQRADYDRALKKELADAKQAGKPKEKIDAIQAEIKRHAGAPRARVAPKKGKETAAAAAD